jgi:secreted Zn-dependent insulinase-like peptidase
MLRYHCQEGLPKWIFDELRSIQEVSHKYGDELSPEDLVETLAEELAPEYNLPPERLLDGTSLMFDYDPEAIKVSRRTTEENERICYHLTTQLNLHAISLLFRLSLTPTSTQEMRD